MRDRAIVYAGLDARPFIEKYGEDAVAAIFSCRREAARRLAAWSAGGGLDRMPRPVDLLRIASRPNHGDEVILFAIANERELMDPSNFDAFEMAALEIALGLKSLPAAAAELRQSRLAARTASARLVIPGFSLEAKSVGYIAGGAALLLMGVLAVRKRRHSRRPTP